MIDVTKRHAQRKARTAPLTPVLVIGVLIIAAAAGATVWALRDRSAADRSDARDAAQAAVANATSYPAEVTVAEASARRAAGAFMLDVRQPEEWAEVHIPGATLVPLGDLPSRLAEVPRGREIVVVCRSGNRSAEGRDILRQAGFAATSSMAGGMNEWTAAGYPTTTGP
jgi:rhodanese-related sulfurtransferase